MGVSKIPVLSLDARYYTDPVLFAKERHGVLSQTWQFAGHASQMENVGDYFAFSIAGENLFCVRTKADGIKAYYNVW